MIGLINLWYKYESFITEYLGSGMFTSNLIVTPTSKFITEILIMLFFVVLSYETIYWSGIYLGLWEYHAKDIFKEIPIHCAHVYIRLNMISEEDSVKVRDYYSLKQSSKYNLLNWKALNQLGSHIFKLKKFVTYYFEFSPEDFEMNEHPEFGSTVEHLRLKILNLFYESEIYKDYHNMDLIKAKVLVFNNKNEEVKADHDSNYLSKVNIETGNVIDCVIVY